MPCFLIQLTATLYLLMRKRNKKGLKKNSNHYWMCNSFLNISYFNVIVICIISLLLCKSFIELLYFYTMIFLLAFSLKDN